MSKRRSSRPHAGGPTSPHARRRRPSMGREEAEAAVRALATTPPLTRFDIPRSVLDDLAMTDECGKAIPMPPRSKCPSIPAVRFRGDTYISINALIRLMGFKAPSSLVEKFDKRLKEDWQERERKTDAQVQMLAPKIPTKGQAIDPRYFSADGAEYFIALMADWMPNLAPHPARWEPYIEEVQSALFDYREPPTPADEPDADQREAIVSPAASRSATSTPQPGAKRRFAGAASPIVSPPLTPASTPTSMRGPASTPEPANDSRRTASPIVVDHEDDDHEAPPTKRQRKSHFAQPTTPAAAAAAATPTANSVLVTSFEDEGMEESKQSATVPIPFISTPSVLSVRDDHVFGSDHPPPYDSAGAAAAAYQALSPSLMRILPPPSRAVRNALPTLAVTLEPYRLPIAYETLNQTDVQHTAGLALLIRAHRDRLNALLGEPAGPAPAPRAPSSYASSIAGAAAAAAAGPSGSAGQSPARERRPLRPRTSLPAATAPASTPPGDGPTPACKLILAPSALAVHFHAETDFVAGADDPEVKPEPATSMYD